MDLCLRLPADCPSRFVKDGVSRLDASVLSGLYEKQGGIAYDPRSMLGILLLAYALGLKGSRSIEKACRYDVRFIHVASGQTPDFRTIGRFRRRLEPVLDALFSQVLELCREAGLLPLRRVAVDGTKVASAASGLARWYSQAERADIESMGLEVPESSDPDAQMMKGAKGFLLGYNVQAAVDCDSKVVVAVAVTNCSADTPSLGPMAERMKKLCGESPCEIVADAGYDSHEGLQACEEAQVDSVIVAQRDNTGLFWTAISPTQVVCPMGRPAERAANVTIRGQEHQVFRVSGCPSCPFFGSCCTARTGRSLKVPVDCDPVARVLAAHRARSPEGKRAMVERMASVEPYFAQMKSNLGFRRFNLRGLGGAFIEASLQAIARNLKIRAQALIRLFLAFMRRNLVLHNVKKRPQKQTPQIRIQGIVFWPTKPPATTTP